MGESGWSTNVQIKDQIVEVLLLDAVVQSDYVRVLQLSTDSSLPFQLLKVCKSNKAIWSERDCHDRTFIH